MRRVSALSRVLRAVADAAPRIPADMQVAPFSALAAERSAARDWYKEQQYSDFNVAQLSDEISARWASAPVPARGSLVHLLHLVSSPEDARTAVKAVEKFHLARAHAGWLTGLGNQVSNLLASACCAHGEWRTALDAFVRAPKLGLRHTHTAHTMLLYAAGKEGGPDGVLTAYRMLRATGQMRVSPDVARIVMRGLRGPHGEGASPRRAFDAGMAFVREGIQPGQQTWVDLMAAAASPPDASVVRDCMPLACPEGQPPSALAHLALSLTAVLEGDEQAAMLSATEAARVAKEQQLAKKQLNSWLATWAKRLPQGMAVPGGADAVLDRLRQAMAAAAVVIDQALEGKLKDKAFVDGPLQIAQQTRQQQ